MAANPPATCGDVNSAGSSNGSANSNSNGGTNGSATGSPDGGSDTELVQPKGISLRVDINYDEYPAENGMKRLTLLL
jgi:hypothetical protein